MIADDNAPLDAAYEVGQNLGPVRRVDKIDVSDVVDGLGSSSDRNARIHEGIQESRTGGCVNDRDLADSAMKVNCLGIEEYSRA